MSVFKSVPLEPCEYGTFTRRIYCDNCKRYSIVTLPKGTTIQVGYPTPSYTLPNGAHGRIICGVCEV